MAIHKDLLLRQLMLLQLIPKMPGRIATNTLCEKLAERGFEVDLRTLQRDLRDKLSVIFPIVCHDEEKPYRWSFDASAHINLPALDTPNALALYMVEEQLTGLLPHTVLDQLKPQFNEARKYLESLNHNDLAHWTSVVQSAPAGKLLRPAEILPQVWCAVTESLLSKRQLSVTYLSRASNTLRNFPLHPAGLIVRDTISYLIARVDGYEDYRQFALHRIHACQQSELESVIASEFNIDDYIEKANFIGKFEESNSLFVAHINSQVAWKLSETPLSKTQQITPIDGIEDWFRLEAQISLNQEVFWWILSLGKSIRVYEPAVWVEDIKENLKAALNQYECSP